jgi:uncharacterized membrane protein HdeD (DUF308 family)
VISNLLFDADAVRQHRGWFLFLGVALLVLGILAIIYDVTATVISVLVFGWILIIGGVVEIVHGYQTHRWGGFFLHLLIGLLYVVVGILFLVEPLLAAVTLTLVLGVFFVVGGLFEIFSAIRLRPPHVWWDVLAGIVTALLGVLLWIQWPASGLWFIGLAVGINMIFRGWAWIMLSMAAGKLPVVPGVAARA